MKIPKTISKGVVEFKIEMFNTSPAEVKKLQDYLVQLTQLQIHRFGPGKIILHFNKDKDLMKIEVERVAWKRSSS